MKRFILAAGVAALAITAPAAAKPGGGGHAEKAQQRGGGHATARASHGGGHATAQASRGERKQAAPKQRSMRMAQAHSAPAHKQAKAQQRAKVQSRMAQGHGNGHAKVAHTDRTMRADAARHQQVRVADVRHARDRQLATSRDARNVQNRQVALRDFGRDRNDARPRVRDDARWINADYQDRGRISGCPPGLAAKHNGCMPPGQARQLIGQRIPDAYRSTRLPAALRDYYRDNDDYYYRYGDGYLYRVDRSDNLISALLPLFGGGLAASASRSRRPISNYLRPDLLPAVLPDDYGDDYYRYANGYVYEIDRDTGLIDDVDPASGSRLWRRADAAGRYSYYNVPYQYRDYYSDTDDYYYRYAPGAIYQVDPRRQLITSVASLLDRRLVGRSAASDGLWRTTCPIAYRDRLLRHAGRLVPV